MARTPYERATGIISNDSLLAVLNERMDEAERKLDKIDTRMWLILIGVAGGFAVQLIKLLTSPGS